MEHWPGKSHLQGLKPSTHVPFSWETNGIRRVYCPPATSRRTWVPLPIPATRRKVPVSSPLCPEVLSACCWFLLRSWVLLPSTEWVHRAVARLSRDPWNCEIPLTPSLGQQPAGPRGQNERWHGDYLPSHWGQDASFETQGYRHPCGQSPNHRPGRRASQPRSSLVLPDGKYKPDETPFTSPCPWEPWHLSHCDQREPKDRIAREDPALPLLAVMQTGSKRCLYKARHDSQEQGKNCSPVLRPPTPHRERTSDVMAAPQPFLRRDFSKLTQVTGAGDGWVSQWDYLHPE